MTLSKTNIGILLLSVLALFSYWLSRGGSNDEEAPTEGLNIRLDYALQDFQARVFGLDGHESMRIDAPKLSNDANTGVGTIDQPRISLRQEGAVWNIIATSATVSPDREHILFRGEVNIQRQDPAAANRLEINTQELQLDVTPKIASTNQPVTVLDGPNRVNATGLKVEFATRQFELLDQVRGVYEVD